MDQAFAGSVANSAGLAGPLVSELNSCVQPAQAPTTAGYGRGTGAELGLATGSGCSAANQDPNQILLPGLAEATAPVGTPLVTKSLLTIPANPLISAAVLTGKAAATFSATACPAANVPVSTGEGDAAGASVLNSLVTASGSKTATSQTLSTTSLVANPDGTYGVVSQTAETIAPVTIKLGPAISITITVQGTSPNDPVILRSTATGEGPSTVQVIGDQTVVVSLNQAGVTTRLVNLSLNQLLGQGGLRVPIPGFLDLAIAEPPRAIVAPGAAIPNPAPAAVTNAQGTVAQGAFDLARVTLLQLGGNSALGDLRVGHFEAAATAPAGGVACNATGGGGNTGTSGGTGATPPPTITGTPPPATVGAPYTYTFPTTNTTGCSITSGSLPAGLSLNAATCTISGTPTVAGTQPITVTATGPGGTATDMTTLTVTRTGGSSPPTITGTPPPATVGAPYTYTFPTTNTTGCSITSGSLPAGLSLNAATCTISGTPTVAGTQPITVTATAPGGRATDMSTLTVNPAGGGGGQGANSGGSGSSLASDISTGSGSASDPPAAASTGGGGLASTGVNAAGLVASALLLAVSGWYILVMSKKRRQPGR